MVSSTPIPSDLHPDARPYRARGALARAWADRSPEVVVEGPAGTGKSRMYLERVHWLAKKHPGSRHLIARKTRESLTESALVTFEQQVLSTAEYAALAAGTGRGSRRSYRYPNGSEVVVAGLTAGHRDQRARIMSTEYDTVLVIEATELNEGEWEQLGSRLRNGKMPFQQLCGECNPDAPGHWLHQRCDRGHAVVYYSRHADNPAVTPEYLDRLSQLTGIRRARLFEGRRASAEGCVYAFDRAVHLIDPFVIPERWPRFRVIDFGYTNPFVCQWWALDGDGRMLLYREWYRSRRTVAQHAERVKVLSAGEKLEGTVADHDAEDRATLHQHGIPTWPAAKAVTTGIQAVENRLAVQPDGRPRLLVMRGCLVEADPELLEAKKPVCTEQEFDGYVWPRGSDSKPVKEVPVAVDDHGMDCVRYGVMWADARGRRPAGRGSLPGACGGGFDRGRFGGITGRRS